MILEKTKKSIGYSCSCSCDYCEKIFSKNYGQVKRYNHHFCSMECKNYYQSENNKGKNNPNYGNGEKIRGSKHSNWKGGKTIIDNMVFIYSPNHPNKVGNYVKKSRLVMEEHLGRYLKSNEQVHHINRNPRDDRLKNLRVMNIREHSRLHTMIRIQNGEFKPPLRRNKLGQYIKNFN